jgi:hypothetical protein
MARKKDVNWDLPENNSLDVVNAALLMDIRDELKRLNSVLNCRNFLLMPRNLDRLRVAVEGIRRDIKKKC